MFDEAVVAATEAAAAAPTDSFYHYWVADLLLERGRFEEALGPMKAALELSPGDDYFYFRAAVAFWGAKKHKEAIRAIRLFQDQAGWTPRYTDSGVDAGHQPVCLGPAHVPIGA